MPLDTQPLSLTRRVVMILVMLALLALALGLAQWLIHRQRAKAVAGDSDIVDNGSRTQERSQERDIVWLGVHDDSTMGGNSPLLTLNAKACRPPRKG
jgi:hypothetical protein